MKSTSSSNIQQLEAKLLQQETLIKQLQDENKQLKSTQSSPDTFLQNILAHMAGNIFWKDRKKIFLGCNNSHAQLIGLNSPKEINGKRNVDIPFLKAVADKLDETDEAIMASNTEQQIEEEGLDIDGKKAIYLTHKKPLHDKTGKVIGLLGISLDITHQKNLEQELKEAKEKAEAASLAKSEFITNMSHDMKTPIAGIIGIAESLVQCLKKEDLKEESAFAKMLLSCSQELMSFFNICLKAFKSESANANRQDEYFNISQLIQAVCFLFEPAMKEKKLTFITDIHSKGPRDFNDHYADVYRIVLNLVANAVKFTKSGSIFISTEISSQQNAICQLKIVVRDTGIGIPKNKLNIIFDQFTRLTPAYKGLYAGNGLGLYLVKKIVTALHGKISVTSTEGCGSEFTVIIPLEPSSLSIMNQKKFNTSSSQAKKTRENLSRKPIKILLVEDNLITQRVQTALLKALDYEVVIATNGEKALELFSPGVFDLIFLDIGLPGIAGDMVSKKIRELEKSTQDRIPIIALTAHLDDEIEDYCRKIDVDGACCKPLSRDQAESLVNRFVLSKAALTLSA